MKKVVAAFDFDGTITYRDSLFPFLLFSSRHVFWKLFLCLPWMIGFVLGIVDRQKTKEKVLTRFFKGMEIEELKRMGEKFSEKIKVRPEMIEKIRWHQSEGHRCILISASINVYLNPWAKGMQFDDVLTSIVEEKEGKVTGKLVGLNCRAAEKVRRLNALLGPKDYTLFAYGDSAGDRELLALADYPIWMTSRHYFQK